MSGALRRYAREPIFSVGQTRPVPGTNVGHDPATTLTAYTGPGAGMELRVTSPATYRGVDFGNTNLVINSSDVLVENCRFRNTATYATHSAAGGVLDLRGNGDYSNRVIRRCTIDNVSQWAPGLTGVIGWNFTLERSVVRGFTDGIGAYVPSARADGTILVDIIGCWVGELSWYWASATDVVHPSDTKTHNDGLQWQGGRGLRILGCEIQGFYSTTVGTGTPNSGNDKGVTASPNTQATGETQRASIVNASGQNGMGGSLATILFSSASRGLVPACVIRDCWLGGGAYTINDGVSENDASLTYSFGEVSGNRFDRTQRIAGWAIGIHSGTTADVRANTWTDDGSLVTRRNA